MTSLIVVVAMVLCGPATAQSVVVPAPMHPALLASPTEALQANKQLVYDFWRDVLEGGQLESSSKCLGPAIRSSRARFVTWLKCILVPLPQIAASHVAGWLDPGVGARIAFSWGLE